MMPDTIRAPVIEDNRLDTRHFLEFLNGTASGALLAVTETGRRETALNSECGRHFEASVDPVVNEKGNINRIVYSMRDVTDKKRNEKALKENEEKFHAVFDASNVGKSISGPEGHLSFNQAFARMQGFSLEEPRGGTWHESTPAEDVGTGLAMVKRIVERHGGRVRAESTPGKAAVFHFNPPFLNDGGLTG